MMQRERYENSTAQMGEWKDMVSKCSMYAVEGGDVLGQASKQGTAEDCDEAKEEKRDV